MIIALIIQMIIIYKQMFTHEMKINVDQQEENTIDKFHSILDPILTIANEKLKTFSINIVWNKLFIIEFMYI